jgi:4-amino-4-deoxy-L-arabinose transferase-like glycosyltransferase
MTVWGSDWRSESRMSLAFVAATAAIFVIAVALVPPFGATFDEAKYLGIGFSMVEGHGPQIVFGGYFLPHAPLWPTVVVAPAVALGIDPLLVGRVLNALSGLGLVLLSAALAWRIRPAAAALAAIGILATTYIHELTRTARLDIPSAALAVAYLALGLVAVRRGSARYGIAAGLLFAAGFLVKEIVLPLAPVPILAAILHRQPWRPILRSTGWMLLSAIVAVAPWFIFVARVSSRVYRLGTPAWTLLPIGVALIVLGLAAVLAGSVNVARFEGAAGSRSGTDALSGIAATSEGAGARLAGIATRWSGSARSLLVIAATVIWVLGLTLVFTRTLQGRGTGLIDLRQIAGYVLDWYPILVTTAIGAIGLVLSIPVWRGADTPARETIEDLWLATVCALPLIILVVGVGEPPRNYVAQMAIGAALGASGWLWLFEGAVRRWPTATMLVVGAAFGPIIGLVVGDFAGIGLRAGAIGGLVVGVVVAGVLATTVRSRRLAPETGPQRSADALTQRSVVGLMLVSLIGASAALAFTISLRPPTSTRDDAVATVVAWVHDTVPSAETIAFGSYLGYEMALPLRVDYTVHQVRQVLAVGDVDAPDGLVVYGKPRSDDWVSVDTAPKNVNEFQAFSAGTLIAQLRKSGADYWVYTIGTTTSAPTIIQALSDATGFEQVAHWSFTRSRGAPLDTYVYKLDLDRLALDTDRMLMAPDALERIVAIAENKGASDLARRLAAEVVAYPRSDATDALMDRLRLLGAQ